MNDSVVAWHFMRDLTRPVITLVVFRMRATPGLIRYSTASIDLPRTRDAVSELLGPAAFGLPNGIAGAIFDTFADTTHN
jgi:hypothetical protein